MRIAQTHDRSGVARAALVAAPVHAEKKYGPGASDKEIKLGQTVSYSGALSVFGTIGRVEAAYFEMLNAAGGINGRKITLDQSRRRLHAAARPSSRRASWSSRKKCSRCSARSAHRPTPRFTSTSTRGKCRTCSCRPARPNGAIRSSFPGRWAGRPTIGRKARSTRSYILKTNPHAKIAVLYQNDDFGKDFLQGFEEGLGETNAKMIVATATYEPTDPSVDSQITTLKASGADTFFDIASPKAAAQAIRKAYDIGWRPLHLLQSVAASIASTLKPAGLEHAVGVISSAYYKDPTDPQWAKDPAVAAYRTFMKTLLPGWRSGRRVQRVGLQPGADHGAGAQAVRRRPDARERDEAGRESQRPAASDAAARDQDQHFAHRLLSRSSRCS